MSQDLIVGLFAPPAGALLFLAMTWTYGHLLRGSRPLTAVMKGMMVYGALFLLGMLYVFSAGTALRWKPVWLGIGSGTWGLVLAYAAWHRHRRARAASPNLSDPAQKKAELRQGLALVALLISLIASSIEWEYVLDHQGHWLGAMLWSTGVVGAILLAYGNRRATVIVGLRAYLGLLVVGAIAERKMAGLILAGVAGAVYVSLERIWKKPQPPVLELEALSRDPEARGNGSHVETKRH